MTLPARYTRTAIFFHWLPALLVIGKILLALFVLHVAGALKHQWFDKSPELQRMLP